MEDFNFLNKNCKIAPLFSGPFRILHVKGDHNVELLLTNGRKIVVNVTRIKPYLSETASSAADASVTVSDTPPSDTPPPPLTLAHSRRPGRPRKILSSTVEAKVLSPDPSISFANLGADSPVGGPPSRNEMSVTRTHPMRTRSSTVTQNALSSRLNVILSHNFHCVLDVPKKVPQKMPPKLSPRKPKIGRPSRGGTPHGDPYKYSDYPKTDHYIDPPQPGIFNDVVGDGYFDDDDEDDEQGFHFEDLVPILEDDSDEYDLEAAYDRYEADAGYHDEGEASPQVPPQPPRQSENNQPPVLRLMPQADQRRRITTPRRPLPDEGGEEEGAVGGEAWQTLASVNAQREFYSALLDKIDNYTRAAEATQRTIRSLGLAQQQERIKTEIWK
jgi:hypothetical protein